MQDLLTLLQNYPSTRRVRDRLAGRAVLCGGDVGVVLGVPGGGAVGEVEPDAAVRDADGE